MRILYFTLFMTLVATMACAAHNTTLKLMDREKFAVSYERLEEVSVSPHLDVQSVNNFAPRFNRAMSRASDADEALFDLKEYNLWLFYDVNVNSYDDDGNSLSVPTDYISSCEMDMTNVGDSLLITGFGYYSGLAVSQSEFEDYKFYITLNEEGAPVIKMGQQMISTPVPYSYYNEENVLIQSTCNVLLGRGDLIPLNPDDPNSQAKYEVTIDGDMSLFMSEDDPNSIYSESYSLCVVLQDLNDPTVQIPYRTLFFNQFSKPNATVGYEVLSYDENNVAYLEKVNIPVYYQFAANAYTPPFDGYEDKLFDCYLISNLSPFGFGFLVTIGNFEVEEEYSPSGLLWIALEQPVLPSQSIDGVNVGKLYMNSMYETDDYINFIDDYIVTFQENTFKDINGKTYDALTFPDPVPDVPYNISYWGLFSKSNVVANDGYGPFYPGIIVFDFVGDVFTGEPSTNSIQDVIQDTYEGAAEYYDLQGIKVANPAPGKIYIVKEGSKVTKRIF